MDYHEGNTVFSEITQQVSGLRRHSLISVLLWNQFPNV